MKFLLQIGLRELMEAWRGGWILVSSIILAVLSWGLCQYGFSFAGQTPGREAMLITLLNLQLYLIPLLSLVLSYESILGERESGTWDLHLSAGCPMGVLLLGKWVGAVLSLLAACIPSFVIQWLSYSATGASEMNDLLLLNLDATLLGAAFISIGLLLSGVSIRRSTAISIALAVWILAILVHDFVILAVLLGSGGSVSAFWLDLLQAINPASVYRLVAYQQLLPQVVEQPVEWLIPAVGYALMLFWILLPIFALLAILRKSYGKIQIETLSS